MVQALGHSNFTLLAKLMDLHAARHEVHAQNVANVNTPNYRRRHYDFDSALQSAFRKGSSDAIRQVKGQITRPNTTPVRNNGNNVDIDMEMVSMSGNAKLYQIYSDLYSQRHQQLTQAIKGA